MLTVLPGFRSSVLQGRIILVLVLLFLFGSGAFYSVTGAIESYRSSQAKYEARHAALVEFYQKVNPEKIDTIDKALSEYQVILPVRHPYVSVFNKFAALSLSAITYQTTYVR